MKYKVALPVVLFLLAPLIYLTAVWYSLPQTIPIHFNFSGVADQYGNKQDVATIIVVLDFVNLLLYLILSNLHRLSKYAPMENKSRMQKIALAILAFMTAVQCWLLYSVQQKSLTGSLNILLAAVCLLFAIMGNYMQNIKPNYFAGFRLPWTLNNKENWRKTHVVAGRTWVAGGLVCMMLSLLLPLKMAFLTAGFLVLLLLIFPVIYSYNLFKHAK